MHVVYSSYVQTHLNVFKIPNSLRHLEQQENDSWYKIMHICCNDAAIKNQHEYLIDNNIINL